ncbi:Isopimaradiene synthase [Rhynchospora pubera]|uniref:Isopimaradiene synthase n=1 Tax=Rhynchospora pubera TaxID=906938 RepID=A0AAV8DNS4_9POAL|nr:Isopimaradiene synthase [Rhynchospora pubera]
MDSGHISPSAYDTAWVARIVSNMDPTKPHFPMCLEWVHKNQLRDGSWGDPSRYLVYDRLLNTLSCILALRQWNTGEAQIEKDVLEIFKDRDGNPSTWPGGSSRAISDTLNLYRYCQVAFPGEKILKEFKGFAREHLQNCLRHNEVLDSWSMKKSLEKEVSRALQVPWTMSLERLEAREYIKNYGDNDIWIAKTLYRWWIISGFEDSSISKAKPTETHFGISATLYEPEFETSRVAYTKCNCLENLISYLFDQHHSMNDLALFCQAVKKWDTDPSVINSLPPILKAVSMATYHTLNQMAVQISKVQGIDIFPYLHDLRVKQIEHYMKSRELRGNPHSFNDHVEQRKGDLAYSLIVIVTPPRLVDKYVLLNN